MKDASRLNLTITSCNHQSLQRAVFILVSLLMLFQVSNPLPFLSIGASNSNSNILSAFSPSLVTEYSPGVRDLHVGDNVAVITSFTNGDDVYDWPAYYIVEVRDANGVSILLDWQTGTVKAGSAIDVGVSWIPQQAGKYQLRTFAITNFDNPEILSSVSSSDVWIASAPGRYTLLIGNRTFDVDYIFSSADGRVQAMKMDVPKLSLTVSAEVEQATNLELVLPGKMLERLETESGFHYCVGNEFIAFVNDESVDMKSRDTGEDLVLTIPVNLGLNTIEILGEDLLQSPPICV